MASLSLLAGALAQLLAGPTLAERLGYGPDDVVLIINCDDLGMCHAANVGCLDGMENGLLTSASLMVPCPWAPEVLTYWQAHPEADIGIHLTHTAEWKDYRWGPIAPRDQVAGLLDPDGYLWHDTAPDGVYAHASPEEAYTEAKAQIEFVLARGLAPSHLDTHMGTLEYDEAYWQQYLRLAREYDLPFRSASTETYEQFGAGHRRQAAAEAGIVAPVLLMDYGAEGPEQVADRYDDLLRGLEPGVWEIFVHAAVASPELSAICGSAPTRAAEHAWVTSPRTQALVDELGIHLIGYRELLALQRAE